MKTSKKKIIFFSDDFNICYSFLVYLQNVYDVIITTNLNLISKISTTSDVDLIIIDTEPSKEIETFCENLKKLDAGQSVILFYVYKERIKDFDKKIRGYVNSVFYKPYDFNEVTMQLNNLMEV